MKQNGTEVTPEYIIEQITIDANNGVQWNPGLYLKLIRGMDTYSNELRKEIERLEDKKWSVEILLDAAKSAITQLQKDNEYWKQRCEAAEENIRTYSDWHTDELTCDHIHENASKTFAAWEAAFKKWQSLKQRIEPEKPEHRIIEGL